MDETPQDDEQPEAVVSEQPTETGDEVEPAVSGDEAEDATVTEEDGKVPAPGEAGMAEDHDVVPSELEQEASDEDATEQQREAVMAEQAEEGAEAGGEEAASPAEEAAIETADEPDQPVAEEPSVEEPSSEAEPPEGPEEPPAGPEPAEEPEEPAASDAFAGPGDWYVIHTYAGYENKVKTNLESRIQTMQMQDKIFSVYIPMEDVMEIKGGRKQVVQKKVFPGYLLVKMEYDDDSWYVVRNTPGVTGFVAAGTGQKPTPLPRHEVEKFLAPQKEEAKPQFRLEFEEGDVVRIITGPFADFNGTISEINVDQSKVKVMVNIFDRETPVELSFDQVARV
ncbi:MAG TPA: transcription termination/antitermination protein NusG [Actinomycetota bacterium]|nr:transcription termination/antitermination protein NusG [Actinomycetota bacterium]